MEKRIIMLYAITLISLMAFIYIISGAMSKIPNMSDKKIMGLTGNVVLGLEDSFKVGDRLTGEIILTKEESDVYGVILLTKDNEPLITKTFNLKDISKNKINSGYSIKIEDLVEYIFEEKGNYELFFSILDLDINTKRKFVVE
jgi:hypothetical protein